jgi:hypothetical protein
VIACSFQSCSCWPLQWSSLLARRIGRISDTT